MPTPSLIACTCRVLTSWLLALLSGCLVAAHGQIITPADIQVAKQGLGEWGRDSTAKQPPTLRLLERYDALRVANVAVLRVGKPALSDATDGGPAAATRKYALASDSTHFRLNDEVVLYVRDLRLALRRSKRPSEDLRLYIGNIALPMAPKQVDTMWRRNIALVRFQLVRNAETEATWQIFYHVPGKYDHNARFTIGFREGQLGQSYPHDLNLLLVQSNWLWVGLGLLVALLGGCLWLTQRSNFIRSDLSNRIPLADDSSLALGLSLDYRQVPFSLAKSQVAFWTLLTIGAYLMITLVTTALPVIPSGLLGLLGISVANGVFSQLLNQPAPDASPTLTQRAASNQVLSRGWFYDVLNDASGVSLARLQFLAFNAIAGVYLVIYVLAHWSLPDFDSGILTLISISSAGFLANKNIGNTSKDKAPAGGGGGGSCAGTDPDGNGEGGAGTGPVVAAPLTASPAVPEPAGAATQSLAPDIPPADSAPPSPASFLPVAEPQRPAPLPNVALQAWRSKLQAFKQSPVRYNSDPAGNLFRGQPTAANGCQLVVRIQTRLRGGLDLRATVLCDRPELPTGDVVFLLHPTYEQRVVTVPLDNGQAELRFFSAGCFTLVAMLDAGNTVLAFDLRNVPGAPSSFLSQ